MCFSESQFRHLVALGWMVGFREGVEAAGGDPDARFEELGGPDVLSGAVDRVLEKIRRGWEESRS